MDLNQKFVDGLRAIAREYDAETNMPSRVALGQRLDEMAGMLSDGQLRQVSKMLMR